MAKLSFLELCKEARKRCEIPGTGPANVTGQTGLLDLLVTLVNNSNREIQKMHGGKFKFMWATTSQSLTSGNNDYTAAGWSITDLREVDKYSFRIYKTADGVAFEQPLKYIEYTDWLLLYGTAFGNRTPAQPSMVTRLPSGEFRFDAPPDDTYTVTFNYRRSPQKMTADADESYIPEEYEDIIVALTMIKYGKSQGMGGIEDLGQDEFDDWLLELEDTQLPQIQMPGPLA